MSRTEPFGERFYEIDGKRYPSVTTALGGLQDFGAIPSGVLETAAARGSAAHRAIELDAYGDLDEDSVDPRVRPYVEAWRRFRDERDFKVFMTEHEVVSWQHGYAGTLDLLGQESGCKCIIDLKCTAALHPAVALQLAAYEQAACESVSGDGPYRRVALRLLPDGTYRREQYTDPRDFAVFLASLKVFNWRLTHG